MFDDMKPKETRGRKKKYIFNLKKGAHTIIENTSGARASAHSWAKRNNWKIRTWSENGVLVVLRMK